MIAVFLIGAALFLMAGSIYYAHAWYRALSVRVSFSQPHICAGETGELTEVIENRKNLAIPILEIGFRVPRGLLFINADNTIESDYVYKRDLFAVTGMEKIVRRYEVKGERRGYYTASQISMHSPSRLFRYNYRLDWTSPEESGMYVYASRVDCSLLIQAVEVILAERESARKRYEDPFTFSSIRAYTIQDPMKTINWKASARTGELMVNTFASATAIHVRLYLDIIADRETLYADDLREMAISTAASLIRILVSRQQDASLTVNAAAVGTSSRAFTEFPSCTGPEKHTAVEEYLSSDFDSIPSIPFVQMIRETERTPGGRVSRDDVCVFLTMQDSPQVREQIHTLIGREGSAVLAVPVRTLADKERALEGNLLILPVPILA